MGSSVWGVFRPHGLLAAQFVFYLQPLPNLHVPLPPTPHESFQCNFAAFSGHFLQAIQFNSVHDFFDRVYYDVVITFWILGA